MSDAFIDESARPSVIHRRRVVTTAAWTVPVVAMSTAVPAYAAASQCTPTTSFDDLTPGAKPSRLAFRPSNVTATLSYARSSAVVGWGETGVVSRTGTTPAWNYLTLEMLPTLNNPLTVGNWVELTVTFSEAVVGLSFTVHDIDSTTGYRDEVQILTPAFTHQRGANIQGAGTSTNRFRPVNVGDTPISSGQGDVRLTWPGTVSSVTIRYVSGITGNSSNQHIGIGNLSYDACV